MINIINDKTRKTKFDENLAKQVNKEAEEQERKEALERKLKPEQKQERKEKEEKQAITPVEFDIKDPKNYIQVEINGLYEKPVSISKFELKGYNNLNWEQEHFKLHENGLYMPTPKIFMKHFNNVVDALNNKKTIYYSDNTEVSKKDIEDIYLHLTKDHIAVYGSNPGAWTWLNAKFIEENDEWLLETVIGIANKKLQFKREKLEDCLMKDCYADCYADFRDLTSQGFPKEKAKKGKLYYWSPESGGVAGFYADSDWAGLGCYRDPEYSKFLSIKDKDEISALGIAQAVKALKNNYLMKTYKNLYSSVCSLENLVLAWKKARKHKTRRDYVIEFEKKKVRNLLLLKKELENQSYKPKPLKTFILRDPKTRKISKSAFRDRVIHHALCNIIEPIFEKIFICDSCANRKGKGNLFALKRFDLFKRKVSKNKTRACFVLKADIKHYF